jgi:hypothetical protein
LKNDPVCGYIVHKDSIAIPKKIHEAPASGT